MNTKEGDVMSGTQQQQPQKRGVGYLNDKDARKLADRLEDLVGGGIESITNYTLELSFSMVAEIIRTLDKAECGCPVVIHRKGCRL